MSILLYVCLWTCVRVWWDITIIRYRYDNNDDRNDNYNDNNDYDILDDNKIDNKNNDNKRYCDDNNDDRLIKKNNTR